LIGFGINELSMTPACVPLAKEIIRTLDATKAATIANRVLEFNTPLEVTRYLMKEINAQFPQLLDYLKDDNNNEK
jgi:phosphoenolpyruvate-protein kinase (PTS system EI component)